MSRKITPCLVLCFLLAGILPASAQLTSTFYKKYRLSVTYFERAQALAPMNHGQVFVAGMTSSCTGTTCFNAACITGMDSTGQIIWQTKIGGTEDQSATRIIAGASNTAIATGYNSGKLFSFKINESGGIVWQRRMTYPDQVYPGDLVRAGSSYFLVGHNENGDDTAFVYAFDESGNKKWSKYLATPGYSTYAAAMAGAPDGQLLILSELGDPTTYYHGVGLTLLDSNGNVLAGRLLSNAFAGYTDLSSYAIDYSPDDHFLITYKDNLGRHIARLDRDLNISWSKRLTTGTPFAGGFPDDLVADRFGGAWLCSTFNMESGIGMVHLDSSGNVLSANQHVTGDLISISGAAMSPQCNLLICGRRRDSTVYTQFVARLDEAGKISCMDEVLTATVQPETLTAAAWTFTMPDYAVTVVDPGYLTEAPSVYNGVLICSGTTTACEEPTAPTGIASLPAQEAALYPNPATGRVAVSIPGHAHSCRVAILDAQGRCVYRCTVSAAQPYLDVAMLPAGLYAVRIETEAVTVVQKLMKQ